jgi:hypothetical protein
MESYPIGTSGGVLVEVLRDERMQDGFAGFGVALAEDGGSFVVRLPGHYAAELAARLREAEEELAAGGRGSRRTYRDEYLDLTVLPAEDALVLSSSARIPLRLSVRLAGRDLTELGQLLERAHEVVDTLRQGVGLVPDRLPEGFAT